VRCGEVHHVRGRVGNLSPDQERLVELRSRGSLEKVLHASVAILLNAVAANQSALMMERVR